MVFSPDTSRNRLGNIDFSSVAKDLGEKIQVGSTIFRISGFVVKIPEKNSVIFSKSSQDILNVFLVIAIDRFSLTRALNPLGVVNSGNRSRLLTDMGIIFPAIIKQDEGGFHIVLFGHV